MPRLERERINATLDKLDEIKMLFDHLEGVVGHFSLVHEVAHQSHHHTGLSAHILELAASISGQVQHLVEHLHKVFAFLQQSLDAAIQSCRQLPLSMTL